MFLSCVESSLKGMVRTHGGLQLLENRNCIIRLDNDSADGKVKLISGGGSGHEPAHAGFVGKGMLTGAVCGNIFSSPSVTAILDCLRTVVNPDGSAIFIVKNYTGDRLNFGIALERARSTLGFKDVRVLLFGEDCSIEDKHVMKSVGKRGLAGVVLVHKILGAMAEMGCNIDDIYNFGEGLIKSSNMATIGFTFTLRDDTLENIEIGKGIHGEPGVYTMKSSKHFDDINDFIIDKLGGCVPALAEIALLINNLGGSSEFLMGIFVNGFVSKIQSLYTVKRIYCGTYLSSLDQAGISVTVLNLGYSPKLPDYLDYGVIVPSPLFGKPAKINLPPSEIIKVRPIESIGSASGTKKYSVSEAFGAKLVSTIITFICEALISCTDMLNMIDKESGDGDTGSTIGRGVQLIMDELNAGKLDLVHPKQLLQQISVLLQQGMGGSSGALYSLFFHGASKVFANPEETNQPVTINHWSEALSDGNDTIVKYALTQLGDRTMLDSLREGEKRLKDSVNQGLPVLNCVESFTKGCEEAARATQHMVAKSGRASYAATSEIPKTYNHPDPGAHAVSIWSRALLEACKQVIIE